MNGRRSRRVGQRTQREGKFRNEMLLGSSREAAAFPGRIMAGKEGEDKDDEPWPAPRPLIPTPASPITATKDTEIVPRPRAAGAEERSERTGRGGEGKAR
ncbi:hypothetical protein E2C01_003670 [Portunus trituberculatus]|uniref:Uncharacterized protein n=1 Tax=Portunus trituberculatus TaxID=210409 RepID=A0A5B7CN06_PORTR|nr:hypothetical protein [Portunus trituberculatus]